MLCIINYNRSLQSEPIVFLTWGFKDQEDIAYSPSRLAWNADFNCSCFYRSNSSTELLHFVAKVKHTRPMIIKLLFKTFLIHCYTICSCYIERTMRELCQSI